MKRERDGQKETQDLAYCGFVLTTASVEGHRRNSKTEHPVGQYPHNAYRFWELKAGLQVGLSLKVEHTEAAV